MEKLEEKAIAIQTYMYDTITYNFDRVSYHSNKGTTPLQGQQDEQPEAVNAEDKAIDHDEYDILTEYLSWSAKTHDKYDSGNDIYDRNRKDICHDICQDTTVKTEENKPYTDIIDIYIRDRAQINQSLSDRLVLGQNSPPGAQQVTVATKHNDQMTEVPDHLRH